MVGFTWGNGSMRVDDKHIRLALRQRLLSQGAMPASIVEEIAIDRGRVIADIVAFFKTPHCFEIKSYFDSLARLSKQSEIYSLFFPKVSLITTDKHLKKSLSIIPNWWGIAVAKQGKHEIKLSYYRKSLHNKCAVKKNLLTMLWNEELRKELRDRGVVFSKKLKRDELAFLLSQHLSLKEIYDLTKSKISYRSK